MVGNGRYCEACGADAFARKTCECQPPPGYRVSPVEAANSVTAAIAHGRELERDRIRGELRRLRDEWKQRRVPGFDERMLPVVVATLNAALRAIEPKRRTK